MNTVTFTFAGQSGTYYPNDRFVMIAGVSMQIEAVSDRMRATIEQAAKRRRKPIQR